MTKQEIFDKVVIHLANQGKFAAIPDGGSDIRCQYRGVNGMCAIGALIPDELYNPSIENKGVSAIVRNLNPSEKIGKIADYLIGLLPGLSIDEISSFYFSLQAAHDAAAAAKGNLYGYLLSEAISWDLDTTVLSNNQQRFENWKTISNDKTTSI